MALATLREFYFSFSGSLDGIEEGEGRRGEERDTYEFILGDETPS